MKNIIHLFIVLYAGCLISPCQLLELSSEKSADAEKKVRKHMACKPGFYGKSCDSPCPSGFFGRHCGGVCNPICSEEKCNPIYGCEQSQANTTQATIAGLIKTSSTGTQQAHISSRIYATSSEKNVFVVTEEPLIHSVFNSTYLLPGLGGVICLVLIAILIQLCMKSKSGERTTHGKTGIRDESQFQAQQGNQRSYDTISKSERTAQDYQSLETEYDEINEELLIHYPCSSKTSNEYEKAINSSRKLSLAHRTSDLSMNDMVSEQISEPPILCAESSGPSV